MAFKNSVRKLLISARLRCPNCEQGRIFTGFHVNSACPVCEVTFERREGESVGGMMLNLVIVETTAIGGFFLVDALTSIQPVTQLLFWLPYNLVMPILLYRSTRAIWIGVAYLNGDVYRAGDAGDDAPKDS